MSNKTMLAILGTSLLILPALALGKAFVLPHVLEKSGTITCTSLTDQDRVQCEQQKSHDDSAERSASGATLGNTCSQQNRVFVRARNTELRQWHRSHRGSPDTFALIALNKRFQEAHKTLLMSLKTQCGMNGSGSILGDSQDSTVGTMPSVQDIEQKIAKQTGATIKWDTPVGQSSSHLKLTGTGTMGDNLAIKIDCHASYPPLKIGCTITISL